MEHLLKVVLTIAVMANMYTNMVKKKFGEIGVKATPTLVRRS